MSALDHVLPTPRLLEVDAVDLAVPPERAWELLRHGALAPTRIIHALFAIRTLPERISGKPQEELTLRMDDLTSTPERPGFQMLVDDPPREVVVGAIGKVWHLDIPFVHVADAEAYARFDEPDFVKVAWAIRVSALGERDARVEIEVRVDATDEASWEKFTRYFAVIGPASRFIRRSLLANYARELGTPEAKEKERRLPGDELLPDAALEATDGITIAASPEAIWPWLVQMGSRRAGFYSVDELDNAGERSAREIHPELQDLRVGQILPATPEGAGGFEVLRIEPARALVLGGLFDADRQDQLPFASERPKRFRHVTWAFVLEPLGDGKTRLHVRARASVPKSSVVTAALMAPVHHFMERAQLRHLAERVEGRTPKSDWRDVAEGIAGAAIMTATLLTPFMRHARSHWGIDEATAARVHPGDEHVPSPRWSWTHGIEIEASTEEVWPWIAQIGADRGGFYSYQWLENVVGCDLRNAEAVHPDWEVRLGGALSLHPKMPPLPVVAVEPGRFFLAHAPADEQARAEGKPWIAATWLFFLEPLGARRCRFISRYRIATSEDLATRLSMGEALIEPIGFAMDRRMLLGVKERVEKGRA